MSALKGGPSTVANLAKLATLSRQATYAAIETLSARGLMTNVTRGKKRFYASEPPKKLPLYAKRYKNDMDERIKDLESLIPELDLQTAGARPVMRLFEGKEALRAFVDEVVAAQPKRIDEITDRQAMKIILTDKDREPILQTIKKFGIKVRALYAGTPERHEAHVQAYYLPAELSGFKANISVYEDTVMIATFEGKIYTVVIENRSLARTFRTLFELAYRHFPQKLGNG